MTAKSVHNKMNCQLLLTNKVCAAVLLLWVMEAMFNRILFCCNGHQGTVLRFVEIERMCICNHFVYINGILV